MPQLTTTFFTKEITNSSFEVTETMGFTSICVANTSATAVSGSVTGSETVAGVASGALTLKQGQNMSFSSQHGPCIIKGLTITAPAGCTIQIIGEK